MNVYLEDGTMITDTRVLESDLVKGSVLIISKEPVLCVAVQKSYVERIPSTPGASPTTSISSKQDERVRDWTMSLQDASPSSTASTSCYTGEGSLSRSSSVASLNQKVDDSSMFRSLTGSSIGPILKLPEFTGPVTESLQQKHSSEVWHEMINQTVDFYRRYYPERLHCSEDYRIIGEAMYRKFPSIARFGKHPWSSFTHGVSSKMRSLRHNQKRRLSDDSSSSSDKGGDKKSKKKLEMMPIVSREQNLAEEKQLLTPEYSAHKKEMKQEMEKDIINVSHLRHLLISTHEARQLEKTHFKERVLNKMVKIAPILERGDIVSLIKLRHASMVYTYKKA